MTTPAVTAAGYAAAGYAVLPLGLKKQPLTANGLLDATSNQVIVEAWWRLWPNALIGLRTGNGIVVVDVDTQHGGKLDAAWPLTLTVQTRSGGWHLYYRCSAPIPNSVAKVAPGVDIRGDGGYVVAAGSPGWSFVDILQPMTELPASIRDAALATNPAAGRAPFEPRHEVSEGGRNDYIARFTGWALKHDLVEASELTDLVLQHNEDVCMPPLPEAEVRRTVRSIEGRHAWRT